MGIMMKKNKKAYVIIDSNDYAYSPPVCVFLSYKKAKEFIKIQNDMIDKNKDWFRHFEIYTVELICE